jgi:hypothetical protein
MLAFKNRQLNDLANDPLDISDVENDQEAGAGFS